MIRVDRAQGASGSAAIESLMTIEGSVVTKRAMSCSRASADGSAATSDQKSQFSVNQVLPYTRVPALLSNSRLCVLNASSKGITPRSPSGPWK